MQKIICIDIDTTGAYASSEWVELPSTHLYIPPIGGGGCGCGVACEMEIEVHLLYYTAGSVLWRGYTLLIPILFKQH
jgi:hypothetical protein